VRQWIPLAILAIALSTVGLITLVIAVAYSLVTSAKANDPDAH
jgi:hypothetical protein